jgi:hypothetical protein
VHVTITHGENHAMAMIIIECAPADHAEAGRFRQHQSSLLDTHALERIVAQEQVPVQIGVVATEDSGAPRR